MRGLRSEAKQAAQRPTASTALDHLVCAQEEDRLTVLEWRTLVRTAGEAGLARARHLRRKLAMTRDHQEGQSERGRGCCSCWANVLLPPPRRSVLLGPPSSPAYASLDSRSAEAARSTLAVGRPWLGRCACLIPMRLLDCVRALDRVGQQLVVCKQ